MSSAGSEFLLIPPYPLLAAGVLSSVEMPSLLKLYNSRKYKDLC